VIGAFAAEPAAPPPPPPPAAAPPSARATERATRSPDAAPTTAPASIEPEAATTASVLGEPGGVEGGVPFGVVGSPGVVPGLPPSPPAPPAPPKPLPIGGRIKEPAKMRHVPPVYPAIAQQARVEGVVIIEAVIGTDGRVQQARVLRSKPLLDEAALTAVRQWVFTPTLLNGVPVPLIMTVTVNFTLR
jgi:protein TonB